MEKATNEDCVPQQFIVHTEGSLLILPLGCQTELLLTHLSAPCSLLPMSWIFLWTFSREIKFWSSQPILKQIPKWYAQSYRRNILSKQLEWYSMKNLVFDFVNNVATQFMICIPPSGALFGSEKRRHTMSNYNFAADNIKLSEMNRIDGDHTLLGDKLRGYSNLKWGKDWWVVTCHDVSSAAWNFESLTDKSAS